MEGGKKTSTLDKGDGKIFFKNINHSHVYRLSTLIALQLISLYQLVYNHSLAIQAWTCNECQLATLPHF